MKGDIWNYVTTTIMKKEKKPCDMCYKESGFNFRITEDAVFHACIDHVKALSDIIYPVGTAL